MMGAWIGVDLDGTLAEWIDGQDIWTIGKPVPAMVSRVKEWLKSGQAVRIVTARVAASYLVNPQGTVDDRDFANRQRKLIHAWCLTHLGTILPVTACKDFQMIEVWDDRVVQVEPNTGRRLDGKG